MNYVIKNSKQVYICLNENGAPVTCTESQKQLFEYSKAKNIYDSLPKKLRQFHFRVEALPEIGYTKKECVQSNTYTIPKELQKWIEKFKTCDEIIASAKERITKLEANKHDNAQAISDVLHQIELQDNKNMYDGYLLYVKMRELLRIRRQIKDEKEILHQVLNMNFSAFSIRTVAERVEGLPKRKYEYRVLVTDDSENIEGGDDIE